MKVIVGCIIEKNNSFVIVKEAKKHAYGKWNLPLGHLEELENIIEGAKRESEEETGLKLEVNGFVGVYQHKGSNGDSIIMIILSASPLEGELKYQKNELLDAKWVTFEEFERMPQDSIRSKDIINAVNDYKKRGILSLDHVRVLDF